MKVSCIISAVLLLCPAGCIIHDYGLNSGPPRAFCFHRDNRPSRDSIPGAPAIQDTSVYFCSVRFPDGYAWQRDTAYGAEPYELLLFKDSEQILCISSEESTCISPDHDTHHIIDGHLYTEYSSMTGTHIGRDGQEIVSFPGREFLKGVLPSGDDLYTLSQQRDGDGFTFRKNGEVLLAKSGCYLFGSMDNPSYGETGALYLDNGTITFIYRTGNGSGRKYFCVKDGEEEEITMFARRDFKDIKSCNGIPAAAEISLQSIMPESCNLWMIPSGLLVAGFMREGTRSFSGIFNPGTCTIQEICSGEATVYCSEKTWRAVNVDTGTGQMEIVAPGPSIMTESDCYFLSPACAVLLGDKFVYAVSPKEENGFPKIWTDEGFTEVRVHGYISRVALEISPAN